MNEDRKKELADISNGQLRGEDFKDSIPDAVIYKGAALKEVFWNLGRYLMLLCMEYNVEEMPSFALEYVAEKKVHFLTLKNSVAATQMPVYNHENCFILGQHIKDAFRHIYDLEKDGDKR